MEINSPINTLPSEISGLNQAHKRNLWLTVIGLVLFVLVYLALSGWFAWASYSFIHHGLGGNGLELYSWIAGIGSGLISLFMIKALFFVKKGNMGDEYEITEKDQPQLFQFLHQLADETGAPRPHRVFLSPQVNACVFYDLSMLNFFFPSKKNLEIGLALVNVLSISELKAVLAHEFGHFAQKSMAVGNWVYIAQQIAAHLIARRDALDDFLRSVSRFDIRVAWIGWILRLVIWSLRSAMESFFNLVVLAQRALSREMEFQADLVAVSVTGSDALIHALHKLQAADEAWETTQGFIVDHIRMGKGAKDIFPIHSKIIDHSRKIWNNPHYGKVPELPSENPEKHRIFTSEIAQPPRMWATHPYNHEREANAKKRYVPKSLDDRSGWLIFDDADSLREKFTERILSNFKTDFNHDPEILTSVDEYYKKEYLNSDYKGVYLGRSFVRYASSPKEFYAYQVSSLKEELDNLYPQSLSEQLEKLRSLEKEKNLLIGVKEGFYAPSDGVIRFRGEELKKRELPSAIKSLEEECKKIQTILFEQDKKCRSVHKKASEEVGMGWPEYLSGLLEIHHYADHSMANLEDSRALLNNVYTVVTADRHVSHSELVRLVVAGNQVFDALEEIHKHKENIILDAELQKYLELKDWSSAFSKFEFTRATEDNMQKWLEVVDSWIDEALSALSALKHASLERLLITESKLAETIRNGRSKLEQAPQPSKAVTEYSTLTPGKERELQKRLDLWDRFQTADGLVPGLLRFAVATGILSAALYFTSFAVLR
ncbi:M48 family metallopeptidase [Leptospira stimsonii]|uniref:Heat-shock protein HtpX n=1 Tax=Leptospira stimsonii TaxID=2202203 RepID=A0ABY2N3P9_9LEPT|nr:M48 family metallopeptidase [Leptospira stimsonii]TGK15516.1 heat-shock protein HtpX [Leptospira stimsonii]TGM16473.1 heat-shock protein HtpX [Leptospira stimsonii]